jgi:hypothetical protein
LSSPEPTALPGRAQAVDLEDRLVDRVFEDDFDWREVVRAHPIPAVMVAAVAGFLVGRSHGPAIFDVLSDSLSERVATLIETSAEPR